MSDAGAAGFFASVVKDASLGATLGPIGAGVGAVAGVVSGLSDAVGLSRWLFGATAAPVAAAVAQAVTAATGTADAAAQARVLAADPAAVASLRIRLAEIAAAQQAAHEAVVLSQLQARMADTASARAQTVALVGAHSSIAWGAPVVSVVVLVTFGAMLGCVLAFKLPAGSEALANVMLGTLAAMATSVVAYWVGSSVGSRDKDGTIAEQSRSLSTSTPMARCDP